jgi:hypothetical protein
MDRMDRMPRAYAFGSAHEVSGRHVRRKPSTKLLLGASFKTSGSGCRYKVGQR